MQVKVIPGCVQSSCLAINFQTTDLHPQQMNMIHNKVYKIAKDPI
jgi:hypothetical protein